MSRRQNTGKAQIPMFTNTMQNIKLNLQSLWLLMACQTENAGNAIRELPVYLKFLKKTFLEIWGVVPEFPHKYIHKNVNMGLSTKL